MYNNKFIVAVKHKGRIMREVGDIIYLPFGSDYSILLKNQNITKAVADIKIDGIDVVDGNSVIVESNSTLELKGFMYGSTVKNKFRFIEKTKKIYDYRGNRIDDGTIKVEFRFEKIDVEPIFYRPMVNPWHYDKPWYGSPYGTPYPIDRQVPVKYSSGGLVSDDTVRCLNDNGITVPGAETKQDFVTGSVGNLENLPSVISILLKGREDKTNKFVKKPLTVKTRIKCSTCGTIAGSNSKFCSECGTFLR